MLNAFLAGALLTAAACVATAQIAVLQIRVVEGEGGVHAPGSRLPRPLAVEITDELGRPVAGATVSFHLPDDGPGGSFTNGLRTEIVTADASGRASIRNLVFNRTPGRFPVRIIAVKEQARAGTLSYQYIAETKGAAQPAAQAVRRNRRMWVAVAVVAGATAGGLAAGVARSRNAPAAVPAPGGAATPPGTGPVIGPPAITVGAP